MPKAFHTKVVGVTFNNDDGTSRQKILRKCRVGESVRLIRWPMKKHPNAVKVMRETGEQLGYLSSEVAESLVPDMDKGAKLEAKISFLTGGGLLLKRTRGCNIRITIR